MVRLTLNGKRIEVNSSSEKPLLWVLREELGLTGTKYGCGQSLCGACTVLIDGEPVRSCIVPISAVEGRTVTTIELEEGKEPALDALRQVWTEDDVPQCGYCQPGQLMALCGELKSGETFVDETDVGKRVTNICRCGTYQRIRQSALKAQTRYLESQSSHDPDPSGRE